MQDLSEKGGRSPMTLDSVIRALAGKRDFP